MKPMPIQMASSSMEFDRLTKHSTARTSAAAPLMNSSTRPPTADRTLNASTTWVMPVTSR
jgi:hypothetical protein